MLPVNNILLRHSRSFEMTLFSTAYVSPYYYSILTVSIFYRFQAFNVE